MKISGVRVYRYSLPLAQTLHMRRQMLVAREGLVVCLSTNDGHEGWGEIAPLDGFSRETIDDAVVESLALAGRLVGISLPSPSDDPILADTLFSVIELPSVRFGFEMAWLHLAADSTGTAAAKLLRFDARDSVTVNGLLSEKSDENLTQAAVLRDAGYRAVKLKVGRIPVETEIQLVHKLRELLGPETALRLDANQAWDYEEAMRFVEGVADARVEYIEEPLEYSDALDQFAASSPVPVALDETLSGMGTNDLGQYANARAIILKPTVLGGILKCLSMAERARQMHMKVVISSAIESSLGIYCLANLSAAINQDDIPAGLDTLRWFGRNLLTFPMDRHLPNISLVLPEALPMLIDKSALTEVAGD